MLKKGSKPLTETHPELCEEWSDENDIRPEEVSSGSHFRAKWVCRKCKRKWGAVVYSRACEKGRGCSECAKENRVETNKYIRISNGNVLSKTHPHLLKWWDYSKNKASPDEVSYGANVYAYWGCSKPGCGYRWKAYIFNITIHKRGCPACAGRIVTDKNRLDIFYPEIASQWHPTKNKDKPSDYAYASNKKEWWLCAVCGREWEAYIYSRTIGNRGCSVCNSGPVSNMSQRWLDSLSVKKKYREHCIKNLGIKVDAYDPNTNTVYEFYGDYWHGNPEKFPPKKQHPTAGKTFGKLHKEALERIDLLRREGYNVVFIWEADWKSSLPRESGESDFLK